MKKLLLVCAALLVVAGLAAPAAEAQQCLKWVAFCDGIQVDSVAGGRIDSQWYHYDCASNTPMSAGAVRAVPNGCPGGGGNAGIACLASDATCGALVGGSTWTFIIDTLDGTLDMNNGLPQTCWIDELAYTHTIGACTGAPQQGGPHASSVSAR